MATHTNQLRDEIVTADKRFMESFGNGDAAGVAALYTESGQLLPPNSDPVSGKPAIEAFWQMVMGMGISGAVLETVEAEAAGDIAYETGRYTLHAGDVVADEGKYVVVWKQENGGWKLHRDIWCTSRPAS